MEDAHVAHILNRSTYNKKLPKTPSLPIAFFGVYDGHGGSHVAQFVARHIRQEFFKTLEFQSGIFVCLEMC
jgi:serine/threonine protein phosphatase PrpC